MEKRFPEHDVAFDLSAIVKFSYAFGTQVNALCVKCSAHLGEKANVAKQRSNLKFVV